MHIKRLANWDCKCDGKQPQCSQCVLGGVSCSGYRQEFIFVSQTSPTSKDQTKIRIKCIKSPHQIAAPDHYASQSARPAGCGVASSDENSTQTELISCEFDDDVRLIVQYFSTNEDTAPAEVNPFHDQICGVWVEILPLLPAASRNKQYFRSAVKTLATSLRRHGFNNRRCEPDMLELYGESLGHLVKALDEARGSFEVELGVAILCLAVADVGSVLLRKLPHTPS